MKSIRAKIMILLITSVLLCAGTIGACSILTAMGIIDDNSNKNLKLLSEECANEINRSMDSIVQSVSIGAKYANYHIIPTEEMLADAEWTDTYIERVRDMLLNIGGSTKGVYAMYMRFNPKTELSDKGIYLKMNKNGVFTDRNLSGLPDYHIYQGKKSGWFFKSSDDGAVNNPSGTAVSSNDLYMISYLLPITENGEETGKVIGYLGMDIDMNELIKDIDGISVYKTGFAYLCAENGDIIYHRDYPSGIKKEQYYNSFGMDATTFEKTDTEDVVIETEAASGRKLASAKLENGMTLIITVPEYEFNDPRNMLLLNSFLGLVAVMFVTILFTMLFTRLIINPIKHLTRVSKSIATGDLDVQIESRSNDELGILAESLRETIQTLKGYIDSINKQAFTDAATGVGNKAAYADMVRRAEIIMKHGDMRFAIVIMDINYLKMYNDKYGHEFGDMLISDAAEIISDVFKGCEIYRIGGDEFAAVIFNPAPKQCAVMEVGFKQRLADFNRHSTKYEYGMQIAIGSSEYQPGKDRSYNEIFNRADKAMYQDKQEIKKRDGNINYKDDRKQN